MAYEQTMPPSAPAEVGAEAERLLAALLYLLLRTATDGASVQQALAVGQHLEMLAAHPGAGWRLRATALQLRDRWLSYCAQAISTAHLMRH